MQHLVDVHCHLLPGVDDGAPDVDASIQMARLSIEQGVDTVVATPHQLGSFAFNRGDDLRRQTAALQRALNEAGVPLTVLPGADVRIEDGMAEAIVAGEVLTLGDHGRHVLLELPHELFVPLEGVLAELEETDTSRENLCDLVGEIANTISGNARREFGKEFMISVPVVIAGSKPQILNPKGLRSFVIPIEWRDANCHLVICLE